MRTRVQTPSLCFALPALALALASCVCAADARPRWSAEEEAKIGREAAAEVLEDYQPVDDAATVAKLQQMVDAIAANTGRPEVKYEVKYVKEKQVGPEPEVNAFSLPGGIIFVLEGLVKTVESDHELAGVLAHEISHNVHYDGLVQAERASKIFRGELAAVLASVLLGGIDNDLWLQVLQAGMFYRQGVLGGYSVEMEKRADAGAIECMLTTPWDPVGLLTFMERLAAEERSQGAPDMGVFKTHPLSIDRVTYLRDRLLAHGVQINRRKTANWDKPVVEAGTVNERAAQVVKYQGHTVFACDTPLEGQTDAAQRAQVVAEAFTAALAEGAQSAAFSPGMEDGRPALRAYETTVFVVTEADEALHGKPGGAILQDSLKAIRNGIYRENFGRQF